MEADFSKVAYLILTSGFFGLLLFIIKKWINDVTRKLEDITSTLQALLIALPKDYADKNYTEKSISKVWEKIDEHAIFIAKLQATKKD